MWHIDSNGMFSIVKKDCQSNELLVRSRLKEDLERLAEKLSIPETAIRTSANTDYKYRMTVKAEAFGAYLAKSALEIDYDNFKSSLPHNTATDNKRSRAYMKVWSALYELQGA